MLAQPPSAQATAIAAATPFRPTQKRAGARIVAFIVPHVPDGGAGVRGPGEMGQGCGDCETASPPLAFCAEFGPFWAPKRAPDEPLEMQPSSHLRTRSEARIWRIAFGLSLGAAIAGGYGRFAYGLILPAMRSDLDWSYTEAGWINTANALGYFLGSAATLATISRFGNRSMYVGGVVLTTLSLIMTGIGDNIWALSFWRLLAGIRRRAGFHRGRSARGGPVPPRSLAERHVDRHIFRRRWARRIVVRSAAAALFRSVRRIGLAAGLVGARRPGDALRGWGARRSAGH